MSLLVPDQRSCHFHARRHSHVNSECTCAHLRAPGCVGLKVRFGEAHQWGIATLVDQQKAVPKSKASVPGLFKGLTFTLFIYSNF